MTIPEFDVINKLSNKQEKGYFVIGKDGKLFKVEIVKFTGGESIFKLIEQDQKVIQVIFRLWKES